MVEHQAVGRGITRSWAWGLKEHKMGWLEVVVGAARGPGPIGQPKEASVGIFEKLFERWGDMGEVMKGHQSTYQPFESIPLLHLGEATPGGGGMQHPCQGGSTYNTVELRTGKAMCNKDT